MGPSVHIVIHNQHTGEGLTHPHHRHSSYSRHSGRAHSGLRDGDAMSLAIPALWLM
jgi:hypothetical protein